MNPERWWRRAAMVTLLVMGTACALAGGGGVEDEEEPVARELTLHVRNDNFYDATVYAVSDSGHRLRLGVARGLSRDRFTFRWPYLELRVVIDLLAAGASLTESLPVSEGDELELTIRPDAHRR